MVDHVEEIQAQNGQNEHTENDASTRSPGNDFAKREDEPRRIELHNIILISAVLIATVTYQAALTPPSTIWKEGANLNVRCMFKISNPKKFSLEKPDCPASYYYYFMIFNTSGFFSAAIIILTITLSYGHVPSRILAAAIAFLQINYKVLILSLSPNAISASVVISAPLLMILAVLAVLLSLLLVLSVIVVIISPLVVLFQSCMWFLKQKICKSKQQSRDVESGHVEAQQRLNDSGLAL